MKILPEITDVETTYPFPSPPLLNLYQLVAQVVTEQVVKAVGQVPVPFIFDTGFRVGGLLFRSWYRPALRSLVNQILGKFATF